MSPSRREIKKAKRAAAIEEYKEARAAELGGPAPGTVDPEVKAAAQKATTNRNQAKPCKTCGGGKSSNKDAEVANEADTGLEGDVEGDNAETQIEAPTGTVKEIVEAIGDDKALAQAALDAEMKSEKPRTGVLQGAQAVLDG